MKNDIKTSAEVGGQFTAANQTVGRTPNTPVDERGHVTTAARAEIIRSEVVAPPAYPFGLGFNAK